MKTKATIGNYTVLLKSNLAQAIKVLYNTRKVIYYPANRDYPKLSEALDIFKLNINSMEDKGARVAIAFNGNFIYKKLDTDKKNSLIHFLDFLLLIPPPKFSIRKGKNTAIINEITVPKLSSILDSVLNFKFPRYWIDKQKEYESISIAIMRIINESDNNQSLPEPLWKIEQNLKEKDIESIKFYTAQIKEWISMGLIL
ncbi:hypothetical protein ACLIKE_02415 [Ferroplasma acidiphilum]|uniref:Uncharacterized protein n=1 Tax=Ferroplasma acidiphilum TaxID=74969 RepID=A0A7K4FKB4_9ARCH|nr:hypothetical protein [Ferroplasma acidiphilum]MCL4349016.1 hypothetical protein [Candidatus Thermoplasmatota archaeon]NOL59480.1 hypothetical protein [Ferroplasma acidiphilum]WMT52408.1 MAG: hypothetical protein RE473_05180 [Ferroplasma acidiphilum]